MRGLIRGAAFCVLVVASAIGVAAEPPPPFKLPISPAPDNVPAPMPSVITSLSAGQHFVIQRDTDFRVYEGAKDVVSVRRKKLTKGQEYSIVGLFVDGKGEPEERTFIGTDTGLFLAIITPKKVKQDTDVDVLLTPRAVDEDWEVRLKLTVKSGGGPQPPKPVDPPIPDPKPKPATSFQVILVYESGDTPTPAQSAVLYGKVVEDYLTGRCTGGKTGWGRRDKNEDPASDTTPLKSLWAAVKPQITSTPALAIAVDNKVTLEPLPATPAEAVALLKKYAEGK